MSDTETIYCPDCGAENLPWADFCRICGEEFSRFPGPHESDGERWLGQSEGGDEEENQGRYDTKTLVFIVLLSFFALIVILLGFMSMGMLGAMLMGVR